MDLFIYLSLAICRYNSIWQFSKFTNTHLYLRFTYYYGKCDLSFCTACPGLLACVCVTWGNPGSTDKTASFSTKTVNSPETGVWLKRERRHWGMSAKNSKWHYCFGVFPLRCFSPDCACILTRPWSVCSGTDRLQAS